MATGGFTDRFADAIRQLTGSDGGRILLAVSGGPDSLALMLLAHSTMPGRIAVATVDHQLRPEAAAEAEFVGRLCAERGIAHRILTPDAPITGNIQASARLVRYALLDQAADAFDCALIATAHHADDQLETMLMRIARGSGIDGLSGIRTRYGRIVRPLLGFAKAELEQICTDAGVEPVRDPSNDDAEYDRVAMRQWLAAMPHPIDPVRASRSAVALAESADALDWTVRSLVAERVSNIDGAVTLDAGGLPRELQRRLLLAAIKQIAPLALPRGETIDRALVELGLDRQLTIGDVLCKGGSVWRLAKAPPRGRP